MITIIFFHLFFLIIFPDDGYLIILSCEGQMKEGKATAVKQ